MSSRLGLMGELNISEEMLRNLVLALGVIATFLAYRLNLASRRSDSRWKRKEYIREAFQERYDSPGAKNASFMLYWEDRHIPLWDDDEPNKWTRVTDKEAAKAILPYCVHPLRFGQIKGEGDDWRLAKRRIALNDSFVDLVWRLDHVRVVSEAANKEDVKEIIKELGEILDPDKDSGRLAPKNRLTPAAFRLMLAWRGMTDLVVFFEKHGYDIRFRQADYDRLKAAFRLKWDELLPYETVADLQTKPPAMLASIRAALMPNRELDEDENEAGGGEQQTADADRPH